MSTRREEEKVKDYRSLKRKIFENRWNLEQARWKQDQERWTLEKEYMLNVRQDRWYYHTAAIIVALTYISATAFSYFQRD